MKIGDKTITKEAFKPLVSLKKSNRVTSEMFGENKSAKNYGEKAAFSQFPLGTNNVAILP